MLTPGARLERPGTRAAGGMAANATGVAARLLGALATADGPSRWPFQRWRNSWPRAPSPELLRAGHVRYNMTRTNPHENAARARKAIRILDVLAAIDRDLQVAQLCRLSDEDWRRAAVLAGCRPPSLKTRHEVMWLLAQRNELAGDPFCRINPEAP